MEAEREAKLIGDWTKEQERFAFDAETTWRKWCVANGYYKELFPIGRIGAFIKDMTAQAFYAGTQTQAPPANPACDTTAPWSTPVYTVPAETVTPDKLTFDEYRAERERLIAECKANGCLNHDNRAWDDPWLASVPPLFNQCNKYHEQIAALDARYKAQATPGDEESVERIYRETWPDMKFYKEDAKMTGALRQALSAGRALALAELRGKVEEVLHGISRDWNIASIGEWEPGILQKMLHDVASKLLGESK